MKVTPALIIITPAIISTQVQAEPTNLRRKLIHNLTFDNPTYKGKRVDYCLAFESECGKPAADMYCEARGYGEAIDYPKKRSYYKETLSMEQLATCSPAHNVCDTFNYIMCAVKKQTYYDPEEHGRALDGCYKWETGCGALAADAFCENNGYSSALEYQNVEEEEIETMTIGDHAVCDPYWHDCSRFSYITCTEPLENPSSSTFDE